jgi:hypothetical protein
MTDEGALLAALGRVGARYAGGAVPAGSATGAVLAGSAGFQVS